MRKKISSGDVILTKLGFPVVLPAAILVSITCAHFFVVSLLPYLMSIAAIVMMVVLVNLICLVAALPLQDVWVDDALYVRNVIAIERIPFSNIKDVFEDPMAIPRRVNIEVDPPCKCGRRIVFAPRFRPFRGGAEHPDVVLLRTLANQEAEVNHNQ